MHRFAHTITVPPESIDGLGHVNNVEYIRWLQDVAVAHSFDVGLDWDTYRHLGGVFVIRRHEIDYLRPASVGEVLRVETWIESFTRITCERHTRITTIDGELISKAITTWVYVNLRSMRPARIPEQVRVAFMGAETVAHAQ